MSIWQTVRKYVGTLLLALFLVAGSLPASTLPAAAATSAHPTLQETIYVVRAGDTLSAIARRYGTTVQAIMAANALTSTRIYVGQRLVIPSGIPQEPTRYQVQRGDTLSAIARRYGVTVQAIMTANALTSTRIYVGQWLTIPTGTSVPVPTAERIQFVAGGTSATRQGIVQFPNRRSYVLRAVAGQTMHVQVTSSDGSANFSLQGVSDGIPLKRLENEDRSWTDILPRTQDYLIQIATTSSSATTYTLYVQVDPVSVSPAIEEIRFTPGAISATRTGTVLPQQTRRYVLRALAGQRMYVDVTSPSGYVNLTVQGVTDGQPYKRAEVGEPRLDMVLPMTQDYLITVVNFGDQSAGYNLYVQIDPAG